MIQTQMTRGLRQTTYLCIICGSSGQEGMEGIVAWDNKAGDVDQELACKIEEDQEEIGADNTHEGVDFGNRGLSLEFIEDRVFGELE
jgi:hypothetical protein